MKVLERFFFVLLTLWTTTSVLYSQSFKSTGNTAIPLAGQTATVLQDGTVLIAGGSNNSTITSTAEIYDPISGSFTPTLGNMSVGRAYHSATLLPDGKVLIAGGIAPVGSPCCYGAVNSADIYDPVSKTFSATGSMAVQREFATATLLQNGSVLISGGDSGDHAGVASAEIYSPTSKTFSTLTSTMSTKRTNHAATLLADGTVLITGGQGNYSGQKAWSSADLYSPATNKFVAVGNMTTSRFFHTATLLADGTVLITGGEDNAAKLTSSAEIYTPSTHTFAATGSMHAARWLHSATSLQDGTVLVADGASGASVLSSAEIYTPKLKTFALTGSMSNARERHTGTLLNNGAVLFVGGDTSGGGFLSSSEIYTYPFTSGAMTPKYIVLGVLYSPPGSGSSVSYTESKAVGTSSSIENMFETSYGLGESFGVSKVLSQDDTDGKVTGSVNAGQSMTWTQNIDSTSTYSLKKTTTQGLVANGPLSATIGVDHDYDKILVWLNPKVNLTVGG